MRKYLPTIGELFDLQDIALLKMIRAGEGPQRLELIEHDINEELNKYQGSGRGFTAYDFRNRAVLMLANNEIWNNETRVRQDGTGFERLRYTHSINGVRNTAKNNLSVIFGERKDLKVDCLAADLPADMGQWKDVFR